jgi:hypothetical protein
MIGETMKFLIALLILPVCTGPLLSQSPGSVVVATTITATAGSGSSALICVATPGLNGSGVATMHVVCSVGSTVLHTSESTVPAMPGTAILLSAKSGSDSVTWLLTKGNPTPDRWEVAANSIMKTGAF